MPRPPVGVVPPFLCSWIWSIQNINPQILTLCRQFPDRIERDGLVKVVEMFVLSGVEQRFRARGAFTFLLAHLI